MIHASAIIYGDSMVTEDSLVLENVIIGYPDAQVLNAAKEKGIRIEDYRFKGAIVGHNALVRAGTIIYGDVNIGDNFQTGHHVLIRENIRIGDNTKVGTNTVIEGDTIIGNNVNIQSNVFIPTGTYIGDFVFIGPNAVLTNDKYPPSCLGKQLKGPVIRKRAAIGGNATILPGVEIGEGSMIAAGAVVTRDVPARKLAIGCPAQVTELPAKLKGGCLILKRFRGVL